MFNYSSILNTNLDIRISISNPTRSEHLHNKAKKQIRKTGAKTDKEIITACLKVLSNDDFVIFSNKNDENEYVQYRKDRSYWIMDYPYSVIDKRSKLLHRLDYVLQKLKFANSLGYWQQLTDNWIGVYRLVPNSYGVSLEAHCGTDIELASDLAILMFKEVYQLKTASNINIRLDSWKKYWI